MSWSQVLTLSSNQLFDLEQISRFLSLSFLVWKIKLIFLHYKNLLKVNDDVCDI